MEVPPRQGKGRGLQGQEGTNIALNLSSSAMLVTIQKHRSSFQMHTLKSTVNLQSLNTRADQEIFGPTEMIKTFSFW